MSSTVLFQSDDHANILLPDQDAGEGVQSNQHLIVHGGEALLLDPGGTKLYPKVLKAVAQNKGKAKLTKIFLSHQDPDIVAAINGWLMTTDADAWLSALWRRFVPHFGSDRLVYERIRPIPDEGMKLDLGGSELVIVPAHFLHSVGNFHLYDPTSRILYTGDMGVSLGLDHREVTDFEAHIPNMEVFHTRYMSSNAAVRAWVAMVRKMDVQTIAPQHGAMLVGPEMVAKFLDWIEGLDVGIDAMPDVFKLPS
ncbi:MAG: MBL fold metallo-hydrolase [Myxococcales bacterium]|nr:MBL fold metallo-hydrolase [Myxococcales bacterium]MCB9670246.1 MBL fold metallo-hydrolase [Alphaproteobacteria bacterium]MCB9694175.1 MBL fold metallo-hydrolase [Alphaproteobacteria bacterium]